MLIRPDEINRVAIDRFVSASGLWLSILASRCERGVNVYYIVLVAAATRKVRKVVRVAIDNPTIAKIMWEDWRNQFGSKDPNRVYEDDIPAGLRPIRWSPPLFIQEDLQVLKLSPRGSHIFVREITPVDEVTARAEAAGLQVMISAENQPPPTMGIVIKLGPDPLLKEELRVGDIVMFGRHAGNTFTESNNVYRYMQLHEIIGSRNPEEGLDDLLPPNITADMIQWANDLKRSLDVIAARQPLEPVTTDKLFGKDRNGKLGAVAEDPEKIDEVVN